jgi:Group II intron, maturase-specific domain
LFEEALQAARRVSDEWIRALALVAIERIRQWTGRETLKQEMAEKVRELNPSVWGWANYTVPQLLEARRSPVLEEALQTALAAMAPPKQPQVYAFYQFSFASMFWKNRGILVEQLPQIFSVLAELDGPDGLPEVERAVRDTARWFP